MKFLFRITGVILLSILVFGHVASQESEIVVDYKGGDKHFLVWDEVTTDIEGNLEYISQYIVGVFEFGADINNPEIMPLWTYEVPGNQTLAKLTDIMKIGQINNGVFRFSVLAIDDWGNDSGWCDPIDGDIKLVPPSKSGGCSFRK